MLMIITGFVMRGAIARANLHTRLKFLRRDFNGMPKIDMNASRRTVFRVARFYS